jgi:putative ABC transport system ATP-binding protein
LISIRELDFRYPHGEFRLQMPSLDISNGERVAVVGASGSGKTTLLDIMAGITAARAGELRVAGESLPGLSDAERRSFRIREIGLVFQSFELLEYLTVRDNVVLPCRLSGTVPLPDAGRVDALADRMGIGSLLARYPAQLSQGERQRAAICRALVTGPGLILADEPTGNLDPDNKQRVLQLLLKQVADRGATLVMVTHDHDLLAPFDRVIDMREFHGSTVA